MSRANLPSMSLEEYFERAWHFAQTRKGRDVDIGLRFWIEDADTGGGYGASVKQTIVHGDTIEETIQAAFDCLTGVKSRRSRLNRPYLASDREAGNWHKAARYEYDYRAKDWQPPESSTSCQTASKT